MTKKVFIAQVIIFTLLLGNFVLPLSASVERTLFPFMAMLAFVFFFLGIALLFFVKKERIENPLRKTLVLTGVSSSGFLVSVVLHNFFYALGVLTINFVVLHNFFEFLHAAFFLVGIVVCPIVFIIGAVTGARQFIRTQD